MALPKSLGTAVSYTPSGAMSSQITFWLPSIDRDSTGALMSPTKVGTYWASITMTRVPHNIEKAQQVVGESAFKMVMRYQSGLNTSMYVTSATGRRFTLESVVDPDDRQIELHIFGIEHN
jgi:hypothetical protein